MGMHFSEKRGREFFVRSIGSENNLLSLENHFNKWPFSKKDEDVLKRFFVREPDGRQSMLDYFEKNPKATLKIKSYEVSPTAETAGTSLFWSTNYKLIEVSSAELILVEQNTATTDLMKYVF